MRRTSRTLLSMPVVGILGLLLLGSAARGEGLTSTVPIDPPIVIHPPIGLFVPYSHLTWEQPPMEWDPLSETPVFCGWDEPSYAEENIPNATELSSSRPAADFRCLGPMPITSIHWWGSYEKWEPNTPPAIGPDAWRITFSANMPADAYVTFNRPGMQLLQFEVSPDRVRTEPVGSDRFPDQSSDSCFRCSLALKTTEYFWQGLYEGDVFWISITALYRTQKADHLWGWKTRPWCWMEGAIEVRTVLDILPSGQSISAAVFVPVTGPEPCGQTSKYDMAFALDTDPNWIKAEQPFTGLRAWSGYEDEQSTARKASISSIALKWQQQPNLSRNGLDVDATVDIPTTLTTWPAQILADDFKCTIPGPVTQIQIWGSWYQDAPPGKDANNVTFILSIRKDIPASSALHSYSTPGKVLWTETFKKGEFAVQQGSSEGQDFYCPCKDQSFTSNAARVFRYTFTIDPIQAFVQTGTYEKPVVYWLSVQALVAHSTARLGWKTSASAWNDDAVWIQAREPYSGIWNKLNYPGAALRRRQTALAFTIITSSQSTSEMIDRQVADDWRCEQPTPVVAATWWGSYVGYNDQACACDEQAEPVRPDYFLLSIWSDTPDPDPNNPQDFGHPGNKLWEYRATQYDEVQVGFDRYPDLAGGDKPREAVFRYSVKLPTDQRFTQTQGVNVYWFSVVAVYEYPKTANYPWGWTNHRHAFNAAAVAGSYVTSDLGKRVWTWQPLEDQTGEGEDMSFVLFQQAQVLGSPPIQDVVIEQ